MKSKGIAAIAALMLSGAAMAAGDIVVTGNGQTVNMDVTATVTASCTRLATGDLDFGSMPADDVTIPGNVTITVNCNSTIDYDVELDHGQTPTTQGGTQRQVTDGVGGALQYNIYQPGTTTPWGEGAEAFASIGTGADVAHVADAELINEGSADPGVYTDLVTVRLCFNGSCQ